MMLKIELHHGSPKAVKLKVGLHHECPDSELEVFQSREANNGASPWESQGDGVHNEASP